MLPYQQRYLIFGGNDRHEKSGGWRDFFDGSETLDMAIITCEKQADESLAFYQRWEWGHIVDRDTGEIVYYLGDEPLPKPSIVQSTERFFDEEPVRPKVEVNNLWDAYSAGDITLSVYKTLKDNDSVMREYFHPYRRTEFLSFVEAMQLGETAQRATTSDDWFEQRTDVW